jgi:hypothetical protein
VQGFLVHRDAARGHRPDQHLLERPQVGVQHLGRFGRGDAVRVLVLEDQPAGDVQEHLAELVADPRFLVGVARPGDVLGRREHQ